MQSFSLISKKKDLYIAGKPFNYIYIKFIRPWSTVPQPTAEKLAQMTEHYDNIDLEFLGCWGFLADKIPEKIIRVKALDLYVA